MTRHACPFLLLLFMLFMGLSPLPAQSAYPDDQPVTLIVPFGPKGAIDTAATILADFWKKKYGQETRIEVDPANNGMTAMLSFFRAPADGYTMAFPSACTYATSMQMRPMGYTADHLLAVGQVTVAWMTLAVHSHSAIKTIHDFFSMAQSSPGSVTLGTHNQLSMQRLFMHRVLKKIAPGTEIPHVIFPSGFAATEGLLTGSVRAAFGVLANQQQALKDGDIRLLGVTTAKRLPEYPTVPTFAELYGDDFAGGAPHGLVMRRDVPAECVAIMEKRLRAAMKDPAVRQRFEQAKIPMDFLPSAAFQDVLRREWQAATDMLRSEGL